MAISDALPERRNLVVTATAFIVFYGAGGTVPEPVVRLSVVNVALHHPEALAIFAWALLFWFQLRFWQSTKSKFMQAFRGEIKQWSVPRFWAKPAASLAEHQAQAKGIELEPGYTIEVFVPEPYGKELRVVCSFIYLEDGTRVGKNQQQVTLLMKFAWPFWLLSFLRSSIYGNAAAEYAFPYVLFLAAVFSPVWSCWLWS
jgi:hypothetical protein